MFIADLHILAHNGVRSDFHPNAELSPRMDNRRRMNASMQSYDFIVHHTLNWVHFGVAAMQ